jgi:AraC-like DNA-binding protein
MWLATFVLLQIEVAVRAQYGKPCRNWAISDAIDCNRFVGRLDQRIRIQDKFVAARPLALHCQKVSTIRQPTMLSEEGYQIRSLATTYRGGTTLDHHDHEWAQLVYGVRGVMTVRVSDGSWVVPAHRAVWVPSLTDHTIEMLGIVAMRTLYIDPELCDGLPRRCQTIDVPPLLRELILEVVRLGMLHREIPEHARLIGVTIDRLRSIEAAPLRLPWPTHPRLRKLAEAMQLAPAKQWTLEQAAKHSHVSSRTIERLFVDETELTFSRWCLRLRMLHALRLLASGESVTSVALSVGYQGMSAFIAAFKRELGVTPRHYYEQAATEQSVSESGKKASLRT